MLWNLSFVWLCMAVASVAILSFLLGLCMDAIMEQDGFGSIGNTVVLIAGFFLTIALYNHAGHKFPDLRIATTYGMAGAFVTVALLAGLKAIGSRLRL
jgi:uncharacterized membrane protein YeaQ/YmgE (transglycosylase-associated protein family)